MYTMKPFNIENYFLENLEEYVCKTFQILDMFSIERTGL